MLTHGAFIRTQTTLGFIYLFIFHYFFFKANLNFLFVCFSGYNGTVLVRLRAVAMERDDNSEGWVPIGAGGLSNVCVVKRSIQVPILSSIPDAPTATSTSSLPGAPAGVCQDRINNTTNLNGRFEFVIYANRLVDDEVSICMVHVTTWLAHKPVGVWGCSSWMCQADSKW